uniref:Uncharacterized protein n=1 Tax=Anopheles maculatus TaxID=74869 RepID=A0A182TAW2_9DIPT
MTPDTASASNERTTQKQGTPTDQQNSIKQGGPATISLSTQSNIEIVRKGAPQVHYPLGLLPGLSGNSNGGEGCRWMRLKIENDFSHMYIQSWQCCITYGTIKKAIYDANRTQKSICLETPIPRDQIKTPMLPYVYALPKEGHSLFLGPYPCSEMKPDVILCQSVEGSLYEREVYERLHDIPTNGTAKRTTGCWVDAVTSRVASLSILPKRNQLGEEAKNACASVASAGQRSLLKRNNISSVAMAATSNGTATIVDTAQEKRRDVAISPNDSDDDDDVVVLETNQDDDDDNTVRTVNVSTVQGSANVHEQPLRKELSGGCNAVDLLKLVQGTMKQNQQKKREIELGLQLHRSSTSTTPPTPKDVGRDNANRKRTAPEPAGASFTAPKVPRRSDPTFAGTVASNQGSRNAPSSTIQSIGLRRLSLSGPQQMKTAVMRQSSGIVTITPFDKTERPISVKITQNIERPSQMARITQEPVERRSLGTTKVSSALPPPPPLPVPRSRLNSVAVERFNRSPPTLLQLDEDDVVLVDDDDDEEMVVNNGAAVNKSTFSGPNPERVTTITTTTSASNGDSDIPPTGAQKKFLSKEEFVKISHKVDLSKTGQQNGYNYDRATGVLKINRSLLNSLQRDGVLQQSVGDSSRLPRTGSGVTSTSNSTVATVSSNSRPVAVASAAAAATPSMTKTMPRMKVVPRVTATTPATTVCEEVSETNPSNSGRSDRSIVVPPRTNGTTTNPVINLKYLSEGQKDRKVLIQPNTKGVLESKIPGLGLVEAVRFKDEVIINLKELTVKKQLVSVPNLEAAVTLLNQFIQRNTYTFKPLNLVIQWQFKERTAPLAMDEKLTSLISQCCVSVFLFDHRFAQCAD